MTLGTLGKCSVVMMVVRGGRQRTHSTAECRDTGAMF